MIDLFWLVWLIYGVCAFVLGILATVLYALWCQWRGELVVWQEDE